MAGCQPTSGRHPCSDRISRGRENQRTKVPAGQKYHTATLATSTYVFCGQKHAEKDPDRIAFPDWTFDAYYPNYYSRVVLSLLLSTSSAAPLTTSVTFARARQKYPVPAYQELRGQGFMLSRSFSSVAVLQNAETDGNDKSTLPSVSLPEYRGA